ncbi:MAG: hypothetical protein JNK47_13225 [Mesorhizobium sp.]|nr:hypothetical protein [Mesorhizobium sp.]MBL8578182.1 hypothetical protein [Mesorhizobium sp.]
MKLLIQIFILICAIGLVTAAIFSDRPVLYSIALLLFFLAISVAFKLFRPGGQT